MIKSLIEPLPDLSLHCKVTATPIEVLEAEDDDGDGGGVGCPPSALPRNVLT